ncbi:MAG: type II toxin-antitoxin system VapC family toxin [Kiritimatiellae bacterium]|nr:type II toxin-antitoxin system VapC family toxin [Kiritimatiellia bacterium]
MYLDTHVVVWLYAGAIDLIPADVRATLEENDLFISPIVLIELQYLKETDRLTDEAHVIRERLVREIGLVVREVAFTDVVQEALLQKWTRDPFDRIIVAQAAVEDLPLLTKDRSILTHYAEALWTGNRKRSRGGKSRA